MGKVGKQNGVLKLVRAGGIVELYKYPIKAAQVMEKYPRHCVTRPDVFKFPYIVVKPESMLRPGRVFFIVPYHTIHRLLQSKGYRFRREHPPDYCVEGVNKQAPEGVQSTIEPNFHRRLARQPSDKTLRQMEEIDTSFFHQIVPVENFSNKKQSNGELKVIPRRQAANLSREEKGPNCVSKDGDYDSDESSIAASGCFPSRKKGGGVVDSSNDSSGKKATATGLKPCLKRNQKNKARSQQGPRVRFTLPAEDDDDYENWETDFSEF